MSWVSEPALEIDEREVSITLSMGVASMPGNHELALDILLNRADEALYDAKEKGRNRVSVWKERNRTILVVFAQYKALWYTHAQQLTLTDHSVHSSREAQRMAR